MNDLENTATKIYVKHTSYTEITRDRDPNDDWDGDDTSTTHYIEGLSLKGGHEYCYYPGEIKAGEKLYLVYAVWSTGDSFHRDDRGQIDFISVHKTRESAEKNRKILEQHSKNYNDIYDTWTAKIFLDNGEEYKYHVGWLGYFEYLDYINVEEYTVYENE